MISRALREHVRNQIEAAIRQVVLRGRASSGLYSAEGHAVDPSEPESTTTARRGSRYGLIGEAPSGTLVVFVKVGRGNAVAVAETVPGEPEIEEGEVLVWSTAGQRVLLNKAGDVVVVPKSGRKVLLGTGDGATADPVVTESKLKTALDLVAAHTHEETGATTGASATLTALAVSGSPNVSASK